MITAFKSIVGSCRAAAEKKRAAQMQKRAEQAQIELQLYLDRFQATRIVAFRIYSDMQPIRLPYDKLDMPSTEQAWTLFVDKIKPERPDRRGVAYGYANNNIDAVYFDNMYRDFGIKISLTPLPKGSSEADIQRQMVEDAINYEMSLLKLAREGIGLPANEEQMSEEQRHESLRARLIG